MARLPELELVGVRVKPDEEVERRTTEFFKMVALAIARAQSSGVTSGDGQK